MKTEPGIDLLRIVLPDSATLSEVAWQGFNDRHEIIAQDRSLPAELPAHHKLELILPAKRVACHFVAVPASAGRHLSAIVTQALEDSLLGKKEDAHIVIGPQRADTRLVWVVSLAWLRAMLAPLQAAGLTPARAGVEYDLFPASEKSLVASIDQHWIFRSANGIPGEVDDPALLPALLGETTLLRIDALHSQALRKDAANFLCGPFQQRNQIEISPTHFKRSAWLALALAITMLLSAIVHWQILERREKALKDEMRQTFATAFPGTPIVSDPYLQWESLRSEGQAGGKPVRDALDTAASIANTLGGEIRPRSIDVKDGIARVLMTESDAAKVRPQLEGKPEYEFAPADAGFTRLEVRKGVK